MLHTPHIEVFNETTRGRSSAMLISRDNKSSKGKLFPLIGDKIGKYKKDTIKRIEKKALITNTLKK